MKSHPLAQNSLFMLPKQICNLSMRFLAYFEKLVIVADGIKKEEREDKGKR